MAIDDPHPQPTAPAEDAGDEANPNSGGPLGLSGDLGVSSERTGPAGHDPRGDVTGTVEGTGSKGSSVTRTDGTLDTSPTAWDAVDVSQSDLHPNRPAELDDTGGVLDGPGPDRTVGEPRPGS